MTEQETATHWSAAANWLHARLAEATGLIAQLHGEKAVLELQLANAQTKVQDPETVSESPG